MHNPDVSSTDSGDVLRRIAKRNDRTKSRRCFSPKSCLSSSFQSTLESGDSQLTTQAIIVLFCLRYYRPQTRTLYAVHQKCLR